MHALFVQAFLLVAAVPAPPGERAARWEYAELTFRSVPARAERTDADGKPVAAVPAHVLIHWTTAAEEATVKGWGELAGRLNVRLKDGSADFQRVQALNALGAAGWEVVDHKPEVSLVARGSDRMDPRGRGGFGNPPVPTTITARQPDSTLLFKRPAR